jgi:hypothetical protein
VVMMGLSKGELEDFMITHRLDMKTEGRRVTLMKRVCQEDGRETCLLRRREGDVLL